MCLLTLIYLNIGYLKALLILTDPRLNKFVSYSALDPTPLNSFDSFLAYLLIYYSKLCQTSLVGIKIYS